MFMCVCLSERKGAYTERHCVSREFKLHSFVIPLLFSPLRPQRYVSDIVSCTMIMII